MPVPEWIFLPVLLGYFFFHASPLFRYRSRRLDGPRLVLECAFWGGIFYVAGRATTSWMHQGLWSRPLENYSGAVHLPFVGSAVAAGVMEVIAALILTFSLSEVQALAWASPGTLQKFLREAANNQDVISVTLDTRKVYIGFITEVPTLDPHDTHIAILPMMSGYRHRSTLEITLTSDYTRALALADSSGEDPAKFTVYIPVTSIRTAGLYDTELDTRIFADASIVTSGT